MGIGIRNNGHKGEPCGLPFLAAWVPLPEFKSKGIVRPLKRNVKAGKYSWEIVATGKNIEAQDAKLSQKRHKSIKIWPKVNLCYPCLISGSDRDPPTQLSYSSL